MRYRFWQWVHNCIAHPIEGMAVLILGRCPAWVDRFHAWAVPGEWTRDVPHAESGASGQTPEGTRPSPYPSFA